MTARPVAMTASTLPYMLALDFKSIDMTDDQFLKFCSDNEDFRFEMTAKKELIVMVPTGSETGWQEGSLFGYLFIWTMQDGTGLAFGPSAGFTLPNGAMRSPDASWISRLRWEALTREERQGFAPICPDFVIELRSRSDRFSDLRDKMEEYMENGARLGWLLDPQRRRVYVYRPGRPVEILEDPAAVSGDPELPGFTLEPGRHLAVHHQPSRRERRKREMTGPKVKFTVQDYMNDTSGNRYQLLDGEMVLAAAPNDRHQEISIRLTVALYLFVTHNLLGLVREAPYDVILGEDVVQPDILFVSNARRDRVTAAHCVGAPDLVVEILSESTARIDRRYKREIYGRAGVLEYWMVHPDAMMVEIFTPEGGKLVPTAHYHSGETLVSPLLPGLAIDLTAIFE